MKCIVLAIVHDIQYVATSNSTTNAHTRGTLTSKIKFSQIKRFVAKGRAFFWEDYLHF